VRPVSQRDQAQGSGTLAFARWRRTAVVAAAFLLASCAAAPPRRERGDNQAERRSVASASASKGELAIVLVTLDGVRWQELSHGSDERRAAAGSEQRSAEELTPNLHALLAEGSGLFGDEASCAGIAASGPNFVSLPGYAEIISGRRTTECQDNTCTGITASTLCDEFAASPGAVPGEVAVITSWADLERLAPRRGDRVNASAGRHGGATRAGFSSDPLSRALLEHGRTQRPHPGHDDFRPDRDTARLAVHHLATQKPRFMWLGLGEPDEFAHRGDYAGYIQSLRYADLVIGEIALVLERFRAAGARTALFVTADHGRAENFRDHGAPHPESARVWFVAAGSEIRARGPLHCSSGHALADIAPTIRVLAGLPADTHANAGKPMFSLLSDEGGRSLKATRELLGVGRQAD
jgi:hypothetical protein